MNSMIYLGLAAVIATVLFFVFMMPEMKNRSTFSTSHRGIATARESLDDGGAGRKMTHSKLFKEIGDGKNETEFKDELYAQGGGYSTFEGAYTKHALSDNLNENHGKSLTSTSWGKNYLSSAANEDSTPEALSTRLGAGQDFNTPYGMNKTGMTQAHPHMPVHDTGLVSNHHTRHIAEAEH